MKTADGVEVCPELFIEWEFQADTKNGAKLTEFFARLSDEIGGRIEKIEHEAACHGAAVVYEEFLKKSALKLVGGKIGELTLMGPGETEYDFTISYNLQEQIENDLIGLEASRPWLISWAEEFERVAAFIRAKASEADQEPDPENPPGATYSFPK